MKKLLSLALTSALTLSMAACSAPAETNHTEIIVFAAASLEATLTQIAENYKVSAPDVTLTCSFDSSGTLRTQIKEGADCDLFISAGQKQMDDLADADLIRNESRVDLLENKVVLAVPDDNPAGIQCFDDLASQKLSLLCIGNEDVPVGGYSLDILENLGLDLAALEQAGKITYGSNVTEVATQVKERAVDCGIIYATDAFTHKLKLVDEATADLCGQVIYPAALVKTGSEPSTQAAQDFLNYLRTDPSAVTILEGVGFTVLP